MYFCISSVYNDPVDCQKGSTQLLRSIFMFMKKEKNNNDKMKIIVAGDGRVGQALTGLLSEEGHDVVSIDNSISMIEDSMTNQDVITIAGNCAAIDTLREAGVENTDLLIAATSADEINLLSCLTAKTLNPKLHTIARVSSPEYIEQLYMMRETFGLSLIINPERDAAREIYRLLQFPGFLRRETFAKGRVEIVEYKIEKDSILDSVILKHLPHVLGGLKVLVCVVERNGNAFIPTGDTTLLRGDHIYVTAPVTVLSEFIKKMGLTQKKIRNAMLVGGGRVAHYLGEILLSAGIHIKIIDDDLERCKFLTEELPGASVIFGDRSSQQLLMSEGMTEMDALVTLSADDELNVITSLYGAAIKVPHVVTRVNHLDTGGMLDSLDIGSLVSPKELCSTNIVQYVRAMQNQTGAAVTLHRIAGGKAEALEFVIGNDAMNVNVPLKDFRLRKNIILACITRNGDTIIPDGNSTFHLGDTVIIVNTREEPILHFNEIFA